MLTLAFDTSSSRLSVALLSDKKILAKNTIYESGKQSELLIPEIEKILKENKIWYQDLDLIAATNGPGSFTGVRVGLTVARTLKACLQSFPLILVNSCEVVAFKYQKKSGRIFVLLDASMGEFFCAEFFAENGVVREVLKPQLVGMEELLKILPKENFFLCGSGKKFVMQSGVSFETSEEDDAIEADFVGLLAYEKFQQGEKNSADLNPIYLRSPRIEKRKK